MVVLAATLLGMTLPLEAIRYFVAAVLIGLGIFCLARHRHPRWVRMQVGFRDLTVWSFLMASAHGAGLMVVPVLLGSQHSRSTEPDRRQTIALIHQPAGRRCWPPESIPFAYLAITGLIAWVVYRKLGLALLGKTWFNFEFLWAVALVVTGLVSLLL